MKPEEIGNLLMQSDLDEESPIDTSSEDEEDFVSEVGSIYDPNISSSSGENIGENLGEHGTETEAYTSKNGKYIWSETSTAKEVGRYGKENVINISPGPTRYAISRADSIKSSFMLFMPNEIMKIVIDMTNLQGQSVFGNNWISVDSITIEAYLGLLLLAGVYRSHGEALESLWDDRKGRPLFKSTMSLRRFQNISRVMRFDKKSDRNERRARDKLAPIRDFWNRWEANLRRMFRPGECVTVDEQLVTYRGRCPFKQYIPSKPGKYGIKIWALCDTKTSYAWSLQVYTGKNRNSKPEKDQGRRVVLDLIKDLKGHNITCDNFFTSHELGIELLKRNITIVGTVRKNKTFLPPKILDLKNKPENYAHFFFDNENNTTILGYVPKKNRSVLLLSTLHHSKEIRASTKKPEIIHFYNETKSGVDTLDQLIRTYTCKRRSNRWPQALFQNILDISAYNAYVIFLKIDPDWNRNKKYKRRIFLEELGMNLISNEISRRTNLPRSSHAKTFVKSLQSDLVPDSKANNLKRARCFFCPNRSNSTKYSNKCSSCSKFICKTHSETYITCHECKKIARINKYLNILYWAKLTH